MPDKESSLALLAATITSSKRFSTFSKQLTEKKQGTIFIDEFSKEIFEQTYSYGKENIDDSHYRISTDCFGVSIQLMHKDYVEKEHQKNQ